MSQQGEQARLGGAGAPSRTAWLGWDGTRLRWRGDAAGAAELCIDGIVFERVGPDPRGIYEREFPASPSGNEELEFSLRDATGNVIILAWRVLRGRAAAAGVDQWQGPVRAMQLLPAVVPRAARLANLPPVAIIVPIFNSPEVVQRCIISILRWTHGPARLILIDDASPDPAIAALLAGYVGHPRISVQRNAQNLGYTRTTNGGIERAAGHDIVLLNSDTEVGPRWLARLRLSAYADEAIGTVTAVSDNAGAFSVPELEQACPIPSRWTLPMAQRALLQHAGGCLPELPTGNGFCMYVKRGMLERVGVLDAEAFPSGYGEENDLCQRAERAGFRHVIAGDVLVHHERSASFGDARRAALGAQGMSVLRERYPDYEDKVSATLFSFARRMLDYRVRRIYADRDGVHAVHPPRRRVLLASAAALPGPALMLARILDPSCECLVLHSNARGLTLMRHAASGLEDGQRFAHGRDLADRLLAWLALHAIELVHIVDTESFGTDLHSLASALALPMVDSPQDGDFLALIGRRLAEDGSDVADAGKLRARCIALYDRYERQSATFATAEQGT
jgi:GT2 family glycosyltransferase